MSTVSISLYLLFTISWFLHLPARVPFLAAIRFDLLLVVILFCLRFLSPPVSPEYHHPTSRTGRILAILVIYIVATIPFVEWPGSVVKHGLEVFLKGAVFYIFTVSFIKSERALQIFVSIFVGCQLFRAIEPLYLHITDGYWGSRASMTNWEMLDRLSGSPHDIINPNGLAFVILTVIPFLIFFASRGWKLRILAIFLLPVIVYELFLTGSRSGLIGLLAVVIGVLLKSHKKVALTALAAIGLTLLFLNLSADQQDRFISIFSSHTKNAASTEYRMSGLQGDLAVALRRPLFGHGLGTSFEANANYRQAYQPSHNLYTEIVQELGFIGLGIFLLYIRSVILNFSATVAASRPLRSNSYQYALTQAMQVWLLMNFLFSFFSYGLSSYEWYLFGGLSVVITRLLAADQPAVNEDSTPTAAHEFRSA